MATKRSTAQARGRVKRGAPSRTGAARPRAVSRGATPAETKARAKALRDDVLHLLRGRGAHVSFENAIAEMPLEFQGQKPAGAPYTPWQQLEHLRMAQRDILDYVRDPHYVEKNWPDDYWPQETPPSPTAWDDAVKAFKADRAAFVKLAADPRTDLLARVPHDPKGPTILHEALLVADHNAYHLGQLIVLRRALGAWRD